MDTVASLMAHLFGPGTLPRTEVYRKGFEACLVANRDSLAVDIKFPLDCPFDAGTLEFDAWHCGYLDAENYEALAVGVLFDGPEDDDMPRGVFIG